MKNVNIESGGSTHNNGTLLSSRFKEFATDDVCVFSDSIVENCCKLLRMISAKRRVVSIMEFQILMSANSHERKERKTNETAKAVFDISIEQMNFQ